MPIPADILTQLADALAEIYPDHASVRMMATTAGVPVERIPVDNKPLGYWVNLLQEAENRGLTQTLLDRAAAQYSVEPRLAAARQAYITWALPPLPPFDLPDKPYRYLDWYRREDAEVFFGRGRDIRELLDGVTATESPPIILLYGQSGVGKSSLLAAGLLPRLEGSHVVCFARRDQERGLLGTFAGALEAAPQDDLHARWYHLEKQASQPLLVILDQVEEVYTRPNPQQPNELADFLGTLESLFAVAGRRPRGRLILSFRKEWLAEITKRLAERNLPRGEVFLERLGRAGIASVVAGPQSSERLRAHFRLEVATALPGLIADDLLADRESPVAPMLAILLTDMWDAAKKRSYDHPAFDEDLYHEFRSRGLSLDDFLGRQLSALRDPYPEVVDSGLALDILAYHTTPLATAAQHTLADLEQTYRHRKDVLPALVEEFRRLYLLVDPSQNQPDEPPASRLAHDTLAPHVRRRFDESDKPGQRARRILETRVVDWEIGEERTALGDTDLTIVQSGFTGMRAHTIVEAELVSTSLVAQEKRRADEIRIQKELEDGRQREFEQAKQLAKQEADRSRQKTRIIGVLAALLALAAMWTVVRMYQAWVFDRSSWKPIAGDNFPANSFAYSIATGQLSGGIPSYVYCVSTLTVGVGCSKNGNTWNFYQQGFSTGESVPVGTGRFSGNIVGITAVSIDQVNPAELYAFATDGRSYRSVDNGVSWIAGKEVISKDSEVYVLDAADHLGIAVAHHRREQTEITSSGEALYVSTDGGYGWSQEIVRVGGEVADVYDAMIDFKTNTVYAATSLGLVIGQQLADRWEWQTLGNMPEARLVASLPASGSGLIVVSYDESSDQSIIWWNLSQSQKEVTSLDGVPSRLAIDPLVGNQSTEARFKAYILMANGDVVAVDSTGEKDLIDGVAPVGGLIDDILIGEPYDLAAVPDPTGNESWLLMAHRAGLLIFDQP